MNNVTAHRVRYDTQIPYRETETKRRKTPKEGKFIVVKNSVDRKEANGGEEVRRSYTTMLRVTRVATDKCDKKRRRQTADYPRTDERNARNGDWICYVR